MASNEWDGLVAYLRGRLPISRPLRVRRIPMKDAGSTTFSDSGRITICVSSRRDWATQVDTLIHEWAHAMEFDRWGAHSDEWGKYQAQSYRVWQDWATR